MDLFFALLLVVLTLILFIVLLIRIILLPQHVLSGDPDDIVSSTLALLHCDLILRAGVGLIVSSRTLLFGLSLARLHVIFQVLFGAFIIFVLLLFFSFFLVSVFLHLFLRLAVFIRVLFFTFFIIVVSTIAQFILAVIFLQIVPVVHTLIILIISISLFGIVVIFSRIRHLVISSINAFFLFSDGSELPFLTLVVLKASCATRGDIIVFLLIAAATSIAALLAVHVVATIRPTAIIHERVQLRVVRRSF